MVFFDTPFAIRFWCPSNGILAWLSMLVHGVEKHRQAHTEQQKHTRKLQKPTRCSKGSHEAPEAQTKQQKPTRKQQKSTRSSRSPHEAVEDHNKEPTMSATGPT